MYMYAEITSLWKCTKVIHLQHELEDCIVLYKAHSQNATNYSCTYKTVLNFK